VVVASFAAAGAGLDIIAFATGVDCDFDRHAGELDLVTLERGARASSRRYRAQAKPSGLKEQI
jgi:hypothetical protein